MRNWWIRFRVWTWWNKNPNPWIYCQGDPEDVVVSQGMRALAGEVQDVENLAREQKPTNLAQTPFTTFGGLDFFLEA